MTDSPVALITGASRGIGQAIALALAAEGFDIAATARAPGAAARPGALDEVGALVTARGRRWLAIESDVSDVDAHAAIIRRLDESWGRLDLFVSNAGVAPERRLDVLDTTPESYDRVMGTNLRGAFFLAQRAARYMLDRRPAVAGCTSADRLHRVRLGHRIVAVARGVLHLEGRPEHGRPGLRGPPGG